MSRHVTGDGDDDSVVDGNGVGSGNGNGHGDSNGVTWDSDRLIRLYTSIWVR